MFSFTPTFTQNPTIFDFFVQAYLIVLITGLRCRNALIRQAIQIANQLKTLKIEQKERHNV